MNLDDFTGQVNDFIAALSGQQTDQQDNPEPFDQHQQINTWNKPVRIQETEQ